MSFKFNNFFRKGTYLVFAYSFAAWLVAFARLPVIGLAGIFIIQQLLIMKICKIHNCYIKLPLFFISLIMGMVLPCILYIVVSYQPRYLAIYYAVTFFSTWFIGRTINFVLEDKNNFNQPFIRHYFNRFFDFKDGN